jgi:outer membrane protein TolC
VKDRAQHSRLRAAGPGHVGDRARFPRGGFILFLSAIFLTATGCVHYQSRPLVASKTAADLEGRRLDSPALKEFLEKNLRRDVDGWPLKSWDFETLYLAALFYQPALDVARAQWQVATAGDKTAGAHPNPTASVVPGYNVTPATGVTPWMPSVTFDWPIETMHKRDYRLAQSRHLSESARLNIASAAWRVRADLRSALVDYSAAGERENLLQKQKGIQERIVGLLEDQRKAGAISSSEGTLARIALDKISVDFIEARQQESEARGRVADAIGISIRALEGVELRFQLAPAPSGPLTEGSSELRERALQSRADILAALSEYAAAQSALQLEIAKQYPDVHLGPGYQFDQGEHKFSLSLTLELPLLNQNQGPIAQADAKRAEAAARFTALQAKIIGDIDRAFGALQLARESLSALEALAQSQRGQADRIEEQIKAGAAARIDLLNAQLEQGMIELLQLGGRIKGQQAIGAVEDALQRPLGAWQSQTIERSPRSQAMKAGQP